MDSITSYILQFAQQINLDRLPKTSPDSALKAILQVVFTIIGAVSIMMVVIGGIKYSASQGDPQAVAKARGTIIYAIVGVVISILSFSIVGQVIGRVA